MLEAKDITVFYGRHRALEKVSIRVDKGEICVILGANGAGKSTLLSAIAGTTRCEAGGSVTINGTAIAAMKPNEIVERGIALVPEGSAIFGELTVSENLTLGAYPERARKDETANLKRIYKLFPVLAERRRQVARTMSGGEQKMLAIGRALMSSPEILMLDEPSLGLSPLLTTELFKALKTIGESGVGILLVEQNANQSLKIADRGYLLENGHIVGEDSAMALVSDPAVRRAYLGETAAERPAPAAQAAEVPPSPQLAGLSAAEIGRRAGELAARATAVHAAFVQSRHQGYASLDASANPEPETPGAAPVGPNAVPPDAAELAKMAGELAEHAAEITTAYIRSLRQPASAPQPASPPASPAAAETFAAAGAFPGAASDRAALTRMAEDAVRRAEQARGNTNGTVQPAARGDQARASMAVEESGLADQARALSAYAADLAARAAAIQAGYHAANRNVVVGLYAGTQEFEDEDAVHARSDKPKHGKKSKKRRKHGDKHKGD
jgi:branched-chain amino acid transport system ATP-binding protein